MLPERLVLVQMKNNCMFCSNPTGESYIYTVSHLLGYITCEKCKELCQKTIPKNKTQSSINKTQCPKTKHINTKNNVQQ